VSKSLKPSGVAANAAFASAAVAIAAEAEVRNVRRRSSMVALPDPVLLGASLERHRSAEAIGDAILYGRQAWPK
jgi:hypothetical protein